MSKNCGIGNVRCELSSGRGCLMYVERGPGQAVCQAQILNAKVLGWSSRRRLERHQLPELHSTLY